MPPPRGKGRFSKDRKPKRNQQSLLFRRKRFCRFTVTGVEADRLQGHRHAARFHRRKRQDHAGSPDRHARFLPASADGCHQARALPGHAAVQRPAQGLRSNPTCKSSCLKKVQPRQPGRRRQGQGRLRTQLPDPDRRPAAPPKRRSRNSKPSASNSKRPLLKSWPPPRPWAKMSGKTVRISQKAGVDGRLFGSVTNADIADALTKQGFKPSPRRRFACPTAR
jgi:hypothetical protein